MTPATNNIAAGKALLAEIDAWCARTKTPELKIGGILYRHPGFVALLRKRLIVTPEKDREVRAFMAAHPDGAAHVEAVSPYMKPRLSAEKAQLRRLAAIDGPCCGKCGRTDPGDCGYPGCPRRGG